MRFPKVWRIWVAKGVVIQWEFNGPYMLVEPDGTTTTRLRPPPWFALRVK